jgi:peptidoglycan/LPS O-acetylase OafA/YrhL
MGAFLCPRPIRFGILAITVSVLIALAVDYLTRQRSWAYRVLNLGPIAYIGTLSYSLYIWQELYMRVHEFEHGPPFPLNLILAVASAVFSYHLIERPFIRLGRSGVRRPEREPGSDVGIDGDSIVLDSPLT